MPAHVLDPSLESLRREFDIACRQAADRASSEQLQTLNQLFRRFRSYQSESDWIQTILDAASRYADYVAVFFVVKDSARLRGQAPFALLHEDIAIPLSSAAAFRSVIESNDPVTALRSPSEVSALLSREHATERAHILPITNGERASAILFASDSGSDMNALELVTGLASSVLERKANRTLHSQIETPDLAAIKQDPLPAEEPALTPEVLPPLESRQSHFAAEADSMMGIPVIHFPAVPETVIAKPPNQKGPIVPTAPLDSREISIPIEPVKAPAGPVSSAPPVLPAWSDLPSDQRQLHIRAQRFARVAVAEMQLARPDACRAGREQSDLYLFLKREIDQARENYRKQFMTVPSMVDYLHLELIQIAAQGDEHKLGADYPGRIL